MTAPRSSGQLGDRDVATLRDNWNACCTDLAEAATRAGRNAQEITVLPVTKYVEASVIRALHGLGLRTFGESRVQRITQLRQELADLGEIEWHLIGHLQRNKVVRALEGCACIHSVDSSRLIEAIALQATSRQLSVPNLYLEVNVSGEARKTGLDEKEALAILESLRSDSRFQSIGQSALCGLMTMAPFVDDPEETRPVFRRLSQLRDECVLRGLLPDGAGLSMGMSRDFGVAIEEGATVVRVGSRLYDGLLNED